MKNEVVPTFTGSPQLIKLVCNAVEVFGLVRSSKVRQDN